MPADAAGSPLEQLSIDRSRRAGMLRRPWWRRGWAVAALVAGVLVAAALLAQRGRPVEAELGSVIAAYPSQAIAVLDATGHVTAARRASVSSKATGRLEWLGVEEGQRVARDTVIARIESRDVVAQRDQAAAGVEAARANLLQGEAEAADAARALQRARSLAGRGFVSGAEVDSAQARQEKATAGVAALRAQIGVAEANFRAAAIGVEQTLIRAPFTGVVLTKNANVGDILTPFSAAAGTTGAVVTMADLDTLEVEADVAETSIARVAAGTAAEVSLDAFPSLRLAGHVSRIVPTVDRAKASLTVKVHFDETDPRLLPDMSAKLSFLSRRLGPGERQPVAAVRPDAVVHRDGRTLLWVLPPLAGSAPAGGERPALREIEVGEAIGDLVRVQGVAPGTRVVLAPPDALREGSLVRAARP